MGWSRIIHILKRFPSATKGHIHGNDRVALPRPTAVAAHHSPADNTGSHSANATSVASSTGGVISRPIFMYWPQPIR